MYIPEAFRVDTLFAQEFLACLQAADLITASDSGLVATHLPLIYEPGSGTHGSLFGHLARANTQWKQASLGEALVIVHEAESYVTPSWYASKANDGKVVPTWNYTTFHIYGDLVIHDDVRWVAALVQRLTELHERNRHEPWSVDDAPSAFIAAQLRAIVGIEVTVNRIEAKAKWSQNRPDADRMGVLAGLAAEENAPAVNAMRRALADRSD